MFLLCVRVFGTVGLVEFLDLNCRDGSRMETYVELILAMSVDR